LPFTLAAPLNSEEQVLTPAGLRPASSVVQIPEGGSINISGNELQLLDASKNIIHSAQIDNTTKVRPETVPQESGWIAYANWYNTGSPISYFTTNWPVPPVPATNHDQTIFLFNSIEPASGSAILQPVLQFGPSAAGGGSYWAVSTWYVGSATYYTPLVSVSVGQVLEGIIELTSSSGSSFNYESGFANIEGVIELSGSDELVWATETLESYGVTTGTDYPEGSTVFSNINLDTTTGVPGISWAVADDTSDGVYVTIAENGASNAVVVINYET